MTVNESEMCVRWNNEAWSMGLYRRYQSWDSLGFNFFLEKEKLKDQIQASLIGPMEWRDEQRDADQMGDCFVKQEQNDNKIYLVF